jgi:hypothetical protein
MKSMLRLMLMLAALMLVTACEKTIHEAKGPMGSPVALATAR